MHFATVRVRREVPVPGLVRRAQLPRPVRSEAQPEGLPAGTDDSWGPGGCVPGEKWPPSMTS